MSFYSTDHSDDGYNDMAPPFDGDGGFDAVEAHFEGVFQAGGDQMEVGGAWGGADTYQGVEPMGELTVP